MRFSAIEILEKYWGHKSFREPQDKIVQAVLDGEDTLALLPTGGGKSICFQVPGLILGGITVVVSPLISLMKDQVENLNKRGIKAIAIYSGMASFIVEKELENCINGKYSFLYISPERLKTTLFQETFKNMPVSLLAVDEAHCISQWGYDFRPVYLEISEIRKLHPNIPCLALTATATPEVATDICEKLAFRKKGKPNIIGKSFARNNLYYAVSYCEKKEDKIVQWLNAIQGTAIVYTRNRKGTERFSEYLNTMGISADFYHAGLDAEQRETKQKDWMGNRFRVMVATNAFGMGIDKPDVRLVLHTDVPESPEAYFQEAGRAGRDGKPSFAVLPVASADKPLLEKRLEEEFPPKEIILRVYKALCNFFQIPVGAGEGEEFRLEIDRFSDAYNLQSAQAYRCLKLLEKEGYFYLNESTFEMSTIRIRMGVRTLYDFMVRHPKFEPFIQTLIRSYGGTFDHYIKISEHKLATRFKNSVLDVIDLLTRLDNLGVWEYRRASNFPAVTFTMPRLPEADVTLDERIYGTLKKNAAKRYQTMVGYMEETDLCRSRYLLRYFGERETIDCGRCDVCVEKQKTLPGSSERIELMRQKVKASGKKHFTDAEELMKVCALPANKDNMAILSQAVDEGLFSFSLTGGYSFLD